MKSSTTIFPRSVLAMLIFVVVAALLSSVGAIHSKPDDAQQVVLQFVSALNQEDAQNAAALTSFPSQAQEDILSTFHGLNPDKTNFELVQFMNLGNGTSFFTMAAQWKFGSEQEWNYQIQGSMRKLSVGWKISWSPDVLAENLERGSRLEYGRSYGQAPVVYDRNRQLLMKEQNLHVIEIDPHATKNVRDTIVQVAKGLEPIAPGITVESLMDQLRAHPGQKIEAVKLRDTDFEYLNNGFNIPGVTVRTVPTLITTDRRVSTPLSTVLQQVWQDNRDSTAGWAVNMVQRDGSKQKQTGVQGSRGPDIVTTLDTHAQIAAKEAVVMSASPAAIVVLQPSAGGILAAAQNDPADELGSLAFDTLVPAGNSLQLVRQAAALNNQIDASRVTQTQFLETAQQLGLGQQWNIPRLQQQTAHFTQEDDSSSDDVENGGVKKAQFRTSEQVTPFGLALLAASIARGSTPTPTLVKGQEGITEQSPQPLSDHAIGGMRKMMVRNVASGSDKALHSHSGLAGMSGDNGNDQWFFGYVGDLAFAVLVQDVDANARAAQLADKFLEEFSKQEK